MAIFIALIIIMIGASILAGIYALINPFTAQLGNIQRYNVAYYGAIASVERAELVLRGHKAGFEGSGGFIDKTTFGNSSDYQDSIIKKQYYGQLALTGLGNGIFWKITSMTSGNVIPEPGHGDLDPDISSGENYNKLTFAKSLQFAFYKDITDKNGYYTGVTNDNIKDIKLSNSLKVSIRAPLKLACIYNGYNSNCSESDITAFLDKNNNIDLDGDGIMDDIVVNRSLFGYTGDEQFTIFPSININSDNTVAADDTAIREKTINYYLTDKNNIVFDTSSKDTNPCVNKNENVTGFNVSPDGAVTTGFDNILNNNSDTVANAQSNNEISEVNLKLSLVNYLKYDESNIYPYLEVKVDAGTPIPGKNFNIVGEGRAGAYDVKIIIEKPIFNTSAASDFTVLF